ncbi:Hypothetical predicted protein, partial [Pelobates cultripes]
PATWSWRLNESLLQDPAAKEEISQALTSYFTENETEGMSSVSVWEAHKSVIRGILIGLATRKRKEATSAMADVYDTIKRLELQHKRSQLTEKYGELMEARCTLNTLLTKRYQRSLQRSKNFFYAHANKGGKFLAHLLKGDTPRTQVRKLRLTSGRVSPYPEDIADEFRAYYESLYNLRPPGHQAPGGEAPPHVQTYIQDTVR